MNKKNILLLVIVFSLAAIPFVIESYLLSLLIEILIFSIFAISYDLLLGYTGIVSFGHAIFFGLGAYISGFMMTRFEVSWVITLPVIAIVCTLIGLIIGLLSLRVKDTYFSMITLAIGQFAFVIISKLYDLTGGDDGLHGIPALFKTETGLVDKHAYYYFILAFLIIIFIFSRGLVKSPFGKVLEAIRENEKRIVFIGFNVLTYKIIIIIISGVMAGFAGSLYAIYFRSITPNILHSANTMTVLFMTILGGKGTLIGPVLGAGIIKVSEYYLSLWTHRWMLIFGLIYILSIRFFPGGVIRIKGKKIEIKKIKFLLKKIKEKDFMEG